MVKNYIWLSFPLAREGPLPPGIPVPEIISLYTVREHGASVQVLKVANHSGTHVDSPRHVFDEGIEITDFVPNELVFTRPVVMDLNLEDAGIVLREHLEPGAKRMNGADIIIFHFGRGKIRREEPKRYSNQSPGFSVEAARWLKTNFPTLRAIGMDLPSVVCIPHLEETKRAHHELLGGTEGRFLIVEDMNLDHDLKELTEIWICPWLVEGMDSGPCSVIGVIK